MNRLIQSGLLPRVQRVSIELDPGEPYFIQGEPTQLAQQVNDALDDAGSTCPRLTHGMNEWTWPLIQDAFRRGHDTRVGFEDSVLLPDGTIAQSNAQVFAVRAAAHEIPEQCLFGSNTPYGDVVAARHTVEAAISDPAVLQQILHNNTAALIQSYG